LGVELFLKQSIGFRLKYSFTAFLALLFLISFTGSSVAQSAWDWHIYGGIVVDGTGSPAYRADILVRSDSIGYIGPVEADTVDAERRMDAGGMIITPGFIDVHAHGDPVKTPHFRNFLAMGVTTIVLGQDGSSPGEGSLEGWFQVVDSVRPAVNVAALSGHGSIRVRAGAGREAASGEVLDRMADLLENDLVDGAYGLSLGLEYLPGIYADITELWRLASVTGRFDGIVMSHLRSEDDNRIEASLRELAALGSAVRVHASHLKVVYGKGEQRAEEVLHLIDSLKNDGIRFTADTYPYAASYTGIGIVFPRWAKTTEGWRQAKRERPEALMEFLRAKVEQRNGPEAILFGSGKYAGRTLAEVSEEEGRPHVQILMEMGPQGASAAHFVMDRKLQYRIAADPGIMISSDGSPTMRHPRGYGSFARIVDDLVTRDQMLTIEQAVYKMSGLPAATLGIENRGRIKTGYSADLLVFDPAEIRDRATFENPHLTASGFNWIWVNGRLAREDGRFSGDRFGKVLRKQDP